MSVVPSTLPSDMTILVPIPFPLEIPSGSPYTGPPPSILKSMKPSKDPPDKTIHVPSPPPPRFLSICSSYCGPQNFPNRTLYFNRICHFCYTYINKNDIRDHLNALAKFLQRLVEAGLKLNAEK